MPEAVDLASYRKSPENLNSDGGDGTSEGMEARVKSLESKFDRIETGLTTIIKDVAEIKGRVANMPSTWNMIAIFSGLTALMLGGTGALFALLRYIAASPQ